MSSDTRRIDAASLVLVVGLGAEHEDACTAALGSSVGILRVEVSAGAPEVIEALRPKLVIASASLGPTDRQLIERRAHEAGDIRVVWIPPDTNTMRVERLVASVAAVELASAC